MRYAVILAGGSGTRLWPLSRRRAPKQVRALLDAETLLQKTYGRVRRAFPPERIFCSTLADQVDAVADQVPELRGQCFADPVPRDTAAAIGYAAVELLKRDPDATFVTINADAHVRDVGSYLRAIAAAFEALTPEGEAVLVGVPPTYPETGYGYIEVHEWDRHRLEEGEVGQPLPVRRFVEKPDRETAATYVESGRFLWNPALFVFRASNLLRLFATHLPELERTLRLLSTLDERRSVAEAFLRMPRISIDQGLMEHLERLVVIPASFGWSDVGHWRSVHEILAREEHENVVRGLHCGIESSGNLIVAPSGKVVATCGMKNCVIIDTGDALLLCPRDRAQDVREVVRELERLGMTEYL